MPTERIWCPDPKLLVKLLTAITCDVRPQRTPATYLFGNSQGYKPAIIQAGARVYHEGSTETLWVAKLAPGTLFNDYTDFDDWRNAIVEKGVPTCVIHPLQMPPSKEEGKPPLSHTGTEAEAIVLSARQFGWNEVTLVAFATHILRAFSISVGQILRFQVPLRIYARGAYPVSNEGWLAQTKYNHGIGEGSLLDSTCPEWERLNRVHGNEYDVAPPEKVLKYLLWRDGDRELPLPSSD